MAAKRGRADILDRLRNEIGEGYAIYDALCGSGITAKMAARGGPSMVTTHSLAYFRMQGLSSMAGYLPICNANALTLGLGVGPTQTIKANLASWGSCAMIPSIAVAAVDDCEFLEGLVRLLDRDQRRQGNGRKSGHCCGCCRYVVGIVDNCPADVVSKIEIPGFELATDRLGEFCNPHL